MRLPEKLFSRWKLGQYCFVVPVGYAYYFDAQYGLETMADFEFYYQYLSKVKAGLFTTEPNPERQAMN